MSGGKLELEDGFGGHYAGFKAPDTALAADLSWTLPSVDGTAGQALVTDGSKTLAWADTALTCIADENGGDFVIDPMSPYSSAKPMYFTRNTRLSTSNLYNDAYTRSGTTNGGLRLEVNANAPAGKVWTGEFAKNAAGTGINYPTFTPFVLEESTTFYPVWIDGFSVTYDAGLGNTEPVDSKVYGGCWANADLLDTTCVPPVGYSQYGWSLAPDGGYADLLTSPQTISANTTFHALYAPKVSYLANGGTGTIADTMWSVGWNLSDGASFTRDGHLLLGWMLTSEGTENSYELGEFVAEGTFTEPVTLYARWGAAVTLTYDANGGDAETVEAVTFDAVYLNTFNNWMLHLVSSLPLTTVQTWGAMKFTLSGGSLPSSLSTNTFYFWFTDNSISALIADTNGSYTFMPFIDSGSAGVDMHWGSVLPPSATVLISGVAPAGASHLTQAGHYFVGWNTQADGFGSMYQPNDPIVVAEDMTLYAIWQAYLHVTYDGNGAEAPTAVQVTFGNDNGYNNGTALLITGTSLPEDYIDVYFSASAGGTLPSNISSGVAYKSWYNGAYFGVLTSDGNLIDYVDGGSGDLIMTYGSVIPIDSGNYIIGGTSPVAKPNTLIKTGYSFTGWNTDAAGQGTAYSPDDPITVTGDMTLYARWGVPITVSFDGNDVGATGSTASQEFLGGSTGHTLTANGFALYGFVFAGWATSALGEVVYVDSAALSPWPTEATTLYAKWVLPIIVSYDGNDVNATGSTPSQGFPGGSTGHNLRDNAFALDGFVFVGWATSPTGTVVYGNESRMLSWPTEATTLYAKWGTPIFSKTALDRHASIWSSYTPTYYYVGQRGISIIENVTYAKVKVYTTLVGGATGGSIKCGLYNIGPSSIPGSLEATLIETSATVVPATVLLPGYREFVFEFSGTNTGNGILVYAESITGEGVGTVEISVGTDSINGVVQGSALNDLSNGADQSLYITLF